MYMAHVCLFICSDCVEVCGIVCCVPAVVKNSGCSCMGSVSVSSCICCMCVSCVHPVTVLNVGFCVTCRLLMLVEDARGHHMEEAYSRADRIMPYR